MEHTFFMGKKWVRCQANVIKINGASYNSKK